MNLHEISPWKDAANFLFIDLASRGSTELQELNNAAITHRGHPGSLAGKWGLLKAAVFLPPPWLRELLHCWEFQAYSS